MINPKTISWGQINVTVPLAVLIPDIPAGRSIATAFVLDRAPGFDFRTAYEQLITVWKAADIKP